MGQPSRGFMARWTHKLEVLQALAFISMMQWGMSECMGTNKLANLSAIRFKETICLSSQAVMHTPMALMVLFLVLDPTISRLES